MATDGASNVPANPANEESKSALLESNGVTKKEADSKTDETCGYRCGSRGVAPCSCLQSYANTKWAVTFLSFGNMLHQTILNGLIGVTISTLEKRFELRSTESALIASTSDLGRGFCMFLLMFLATDIDKPRIIGWGLIVAGTASVMYAMPHFTAPVYTYMVGDVLNYCGNVTEPDCTTSALRTYQYWFIVFAVLVGAGTCPLVVSGLTYLDENVKKKDSSLYNSIFNAVGGLGPAVGYVFGGMTLEVYTYLTVDPEGIHSGSYSWVGAWWLGYIVTGVLLAATGLPLLMFPKYLPGTESHRKDRNVEAQGKHLKSSEQSRNRGVMAKLSDVYILLQNAPYVIMTIGNTMNLALIFGFNTFGAKYLESVFGLTPFHSSLLYGIAAIFASFGAQICSGLVLKRFDLQVPGILKFMIVTGICSALCSIGFLVHCDEISFAGGSVPYPNTTELMTMSASCNSNCNCTTDRYEPVCANGLTYFSPCFAGCETRLNDTSYTSCSCVTDGNSTRADLDVIVSSKNCDWNSCSMIIAFTFVVFFCFFTSVLTLTPATQVILRCVPFNKRDMAISLTAATTRIAGIIPGRLLVGYVLDQACISWSTECGELGSCKVYNRWEVARNNTILLLSQTIVCAIAYVLVLVTYKPAGGTVRDTSTGQKTDLYSGDGDVSNSGAIHKDIQDNGTGTSNGTGNTRV